MEDHGPEQAEALIRAVDEALAAVQGQAATIGQSTAALYRDGLLAGLPEPRAFDFALYMLRYFLDKSPVTAGAAGPAAA